MRGSQCKRMLQRVRMINQMKLIDLNYIFQNIEEFRQYMLCLCCSQVIASIPEAVTCIMNLRFEAGNNSVSATIGMLLQQLVPAIATYSAAHSIVVDSGLDEILLQFVTLSSLQFIRNWRLGHLHDTA